MPKYRSVSESYAPWYEHSARIDQVENVVAIDHHQPLIRIQIEGHVLAIVLRVGLHGAWPDAHLGIIVGFSDAWDLDVAL